MTAEAVMWPVVPTMSLLPHNSQRTNHSSIVLFLCQYANRRGSRGGTCFCRQKSAVKRIRAWQAPEIHVAVTPERLRAPTLMLVVTADSCRHACVVTVVFGPDRPCVVACEMLCKSPVLCETDNNITTTEICQWGARMVIAQ